MRDALPQKIREKESGIVNLNDTTGPGTHWVAYVKNGRRASYFDSFGNLRPPMEIIRYLGKDGTEISYNREARQMYDESICGQLCLRFLRDYDWKQ